MSPRTPECYCRRWPLSVALVLALLAGTCGRTSEITRTGPSLVKCEVSLSTSTNTIAATGGSGTIAVATNPECVWTASSQASWISGLSPQSGQGNGNISFNVAANGAATARDGQIVVNDTQLRLQQQPAACQFTVSPDEQSLPASGGSGSLNVTALSGCTWNAIASEPWISIDSGASGSGTGVVRFSVSQNTQSARSGTVTVADQAGTIEQAGQPQSLCTFTLSSPGTLVPATGAAGTVTLQTNNGCAWTASSTVSWAGITNGNSGNASGVISFAVSANTGAARTGTLRIAGQTFTISQAAAASCAFTIAPTSQSVAAGGGPGSPVSVTTNAGCTWSAESQVPWITITSGASGTGPGTAQFSVNANSGASRTGSLTIAGHTFTVTQDAAATPCSYSINPTTQSIAAAGGAGTPVAITTSTGCTWTASSNASWLTITSAASGTGPATLQFTIASNSGAARTGTLTIAGQTFTVTQTAAPVCKFELNPSSKTVNEDARSDDVDVKTGGGCTWTATSNVAWIQITSGSSGTGNGKVRYHVDRNQSSNSRTGTLTIAGLTFTLTQRGADE
jgi:all-beta uncharacterized protein/BACON domain-containing protein